uniref:Uncharacterized protein n=1 Tax=Opuntia streptacantha TaxID=393608 RepID=A0A7C9AYP0_OPUST
MASLNPFQIHQIIPLETPFISLSAPSANRRQPRAGSDGGDGIPARGLRLFEEAGGVGGSVERRMALRQRRLRAVRLRNQEGRRTPRPPLLCVPAYLFGG